MENRKPSYPFRKLPVILLIILAMSLTLLFIRDTTKGWLLDNTHLSGQDRLLIYVGDIRRTLARYDFLPYLIAEHQPSRSLLEGDVSQREAVETYLAQLDKASQTRGWYLLNSNGDFVASSSPVYKWRDSDGAAITSLMQQLGGEVVTLSYLSQGQARYYRAAPIYSSQGLIGIAVARINLQTLSESWLANNEFVLISDRQKRFFLTSSQSSLNHQIGKDTMPPLSPFSLPDGTEVSLVSIENQPYLVQSVSLDDLKWNIHYLTPIKELDDTVNTVMLIAAILMLLVLVVILLTIERRQKIRSREALQQAISDSERQLRTIISKTDVGLMMLTEQGRVAYINPMALRYFGLSEPLATNMEAWQLFETMMGNTTVMSMLKNLSTRIDTSKNARSSDHAGFQTQRNKDITELSAVEVMAQRSDGSRFPTLFSLTYMTFGAQSGYLATLIDISKRKKAENALQKANLELEERVKARTLALEAAQDELVQNSKMAALGRMSSAITHELNQPLTGIRTLLSSSGVLIERQQTDLLKANMKLVDSLIDRMATMTSELKTFSYSRSQELVPLSISAITEEVLRLHARTLKPVQVTVNWPSPMPDALGEPHRLALVIGNLISNAVDAMNQSTAPMLKIESTVLEDTIELHIRDNGTGSTDEALQHLFEPFYTSKKVGQGLGLGLAISANSMKEMQGKVWAKNNSSSPIKNATPVFESGMTFTLSLKKTS
ncbi:sensor histidine kinase [Vibrio sp. vnigr-6D03]|uniref:ATP-binding protein n=1 Tax=Vibrio sp. vnigr-6D03 TaxID=2058088 RepID=UPI000C33FC7A|nr:ATP-binding protein [Vibrio sp. vnigr-6D03]PKF81258.1 sensor histidine kinase [Vibrio sp. vnigr-6D03]